MLAFQGSFDTTASLAALYLWLMFNYLSSVLNCDLQRMFRENALLRHLLGLIAFYFLFTVIDPNNNAHVLIVFWKTIVVYILFLLATRSRWYFATATLLLLLIDQVIKNHIAYLEKQNQMTYVEPWKRVRPILLWLIVSVILVGSVDYMLKQRRDRRNAFRWSTFFLGTNKCRA